MAIIESAAQLVFMIHLVENPICLKDVNIIPHNDYPQLEHDGLIEVDYLVPGDMPTVTPTAKGIAYVEYIRNLPLPEEQTVFFFTEPAGVLDTTIC